MGVAPAIADLLEEPTHRDQGVAERLSQLAGLRRLDRRLAGLVAWKQLDLKGASDFGWKGCKRDNLDKLQSQSGKREQTLEDSQSGARAGEPVLGESRGFQSTSVQQRAADKVDGDLAMVVGRVAEARQVGSAFTFANPVQAAQTYDQVAQSG